MKSKKLHLIFIAASLAVCNVVSAQLVIDNAQFFIQPGASVTVQGDVTSNTDILGTGKLILKGTANQNINMGGFTIPNLEMDNTANATLTGNVKIGSSLLFTNGKIMLGTNDFILAAGSTSTGMATNKFLETNGTGFVRRELTADIVNSEIPVGTGSDYTPVFVSNTGSTYASASIGAQAKGIADPNKHPRTESYLTVYWPIVKTGIAGGTASAVATYVDPARVTGIETDLKGMYWDGTNWSIAGGTQNAALNTAGATISGTSGELYAMNTFVLVNPKAFLQGPYNTVTARMNDKLRTNTAYVPGTLPASNLLPATDPYRSAPYNFIHVNNALPENVISTSFANPFIDQANPDDNIVDWVFLELRTAITPGNTILQTRSALIQRDGDIVDIDGISPVYFKNVTPGSYTLTVRHRNHLALSTNPATFTKALSLISSPLDMAGLTAANLMGAPNTNYFNNGTLNMLYAGNANFNSNVRWSPPSSDKDYILSVVLSNSAANVLSNTYSSGDIDLNRGVRWSPPGSDKDFILSVPLSNSAANVKAQILPN